MTPLDGLSEAEFAALARSVPTPPPESLKVSRGVRLQDGTVIDLSGIDGGQALDELFPHALHIAVDGYGNSWCLDLGGPEWGPVFFCGHDPPIVVYQAATGQEFASWGVLPEVLGCRERALPEEDGWEWFDLRTPEPGDGFCWGLYGPRTELRRHPAERIFGRKKVPKKPWWKLFGLLVAALLQPGLGLLHLVHG